LDPGEEAREDKSSERSVGDIAQFGCSMTGFAFQLAELSGDLSVVIFGERDCANAFPRNRLSPGGVNPWTVYTAGIREADVLGGTVEERLDECLRAVIATAPHRPVVVLSTCLTEMVGAVVDPVCSAVESDTGVRVIGLRTSGLKPLSQAAIVDWLAETLVKEFGVFGPADHAALNLVGFQTAPHHPLRRELEEVLESMDLRLNAAIPLGARLEHWQAMPGAGLTVVSEKAMYPRLLGALERPGHHVMEAPPPKGLVGTDAFYRALADRAGRKADLEPLESRHRAARALEGARTRFRGRRLAYGLGSHHNFAAEQMSLEGLADLPLLQELGFDVELVIQERDEPEVHDRIRHNLSLLGVHIPYRLFYEPAVLAPVLEEGGFHVAYLTDFLSDQADRAGVPMIRLGFFQSGYWGAWDACVKLDRTLAGGFERRYRRYL